MKEDLNILQKYCNDDDPDYKGIRSIEHLFNKIDEDYYKSVKTKDNFNDNYIEYENRGDKDKKLSIKEYFLTII